MKMIPSIKRLSFFMATSVILCMLTTACADITMQIDVKSILNARAVSTYSNGKMYTWTRGIDGNGYGDGYLTMSAALHMGNVNPHALSDTGKFAANGSHPEIVLNYSNADSTNPQTHYLSGADSVSFSVPLGNYSKLFLVLTSSEGTSTVHVTLTYSGSVETRDYVVPDYYNDIAANDTNFCYVAHDLAKWGTQNNMTEATHHNIDALNVHPNPAKMLTGVKLSKTAAGYLVFWGATGVAMSTAMNIPPRKNADGTQPRLCSVVSCGGFTRISAIRPGSIFSVFSPSGARECRVSCAAGGSLTLGLKGDIKIGPGMHVCEIRNGMETQKFQVLVSR
jgi:hypothetical protein